MASHVPSEGGAAASASPSVYPHLTIPVAWLVRFLEAVGGNSNVRRCVWRVAPRVAARTDGRGGQPERRRGRLSALDANAVALAGLCSSGTAIGVMSARVHLVAVFPKIGAAAFHHASATTFGLRGLRGLRGLGGFRG